MASDENRFSKMSKMSKLNKEKSNSLDDILTKEQMEVYEEELLTEMRKHMKSRFRGN